ncbi:MAG: hypothetical protein AB7O95_13110 [Geminicoccaceae bacterium]
MSVDAGHSQVPESVGSHEGGNVERREALRRFGVYAACTAPAMTVLLASRQSAAGSFFNNGDAHRRGRSGLPGGGGGGGGSCGFSC